MNQFSEIKWPLLIFTCVMLISCTRVKKHHFEKAVKAISHSELNIFNFQQQADSTAAIYTDQKPVDMPKTGSAGNQSTNPFFKPGNDGPGDGGGNPSMRSDAGVETMKVSSGAGDKGCPGKEILGNRYALMNVTPDAVQIDGVVVIKISVNKEGDVVRAEIHPQGTTTSDMGARNSARNAAMRTRFEANLSGCETRSGLLKYTFRLN